MNRQDNSDERGKVGEKLLLTMAEAAQLLSISERTLWRWSRCGLAPRPISIGLGTRSAVRFRRSELITWVDDGCPRVDQIEKRSAR